MPDINWGMLAPQNPALDPVTAMHVADSDRAQAAQVKIAQQEAALKQQAFQANQAASAAAQQRYAAAADAYGKGDFRGAQAALIGTGNHDMVNAGATSSRDEFSREQQGAQTLANTAKFIMDNIPLEHRAEFIKHNAEWFHGAGATPEQIAAVAADPSDEVLGAVHDTFYDVKDQDAHAVSQQNADSTTQNAETSRYGAQTSRMAEMRQSQTPIAIDPTKDVYLPGGATAGAAPTQGGYVPGSQLATMFASVPSARITSVDRTAAHNREVNGVPNSQHVAGTAIDMVGVSPQQAKAILAQNGLTGEVIQHDAGSGIHTHIESVRPIAQATANGPRRIVAGTPKAADGVSIATDKTGPEFLATLPADRKAMVVAIAEGRAAPPNARTKLGQQLLAEVAQYDPTFDAADSTSRNKTRVDFTSGKSRVAITALNTAFGHLAHLDDQAKNLGNFETLPGILNPAYNAARTALGNTALPAFDQTKQAAASELRKVFAGSGGGSLAELEAWERQLDTAKSYPQLHNVIRNGIDLMGSRLMALRQQYVEGMGRSSQPPRFITDQNLKVAKDRFGIVLNDGPVGGQQPASSGGPRAPAVGTVKGGYRFNGGNPADPKSWSRVQ